MHAFWLDKTEHGNWPYSVYHPAEGFYRFASEPVIADLDDNGYAEVIFTSWTQKGFGSTGKLHILDYQSNPIYEVNLPAAFGSANWNGALPAPSLADIDADPDLEVVLLTAHSGVVAYDLPGTQNATVLWSSGRGDYLRDGNLANAIQATLRDSNKISSLTHANPGDLLTFTINLRNPGPIIEDASMIDTLPPDLVYAGNLWASSGIASYSAGTVSWHGEVTTSTDVIIRFDATVDAAIIDPTAITNNAAIYDGEGREWQRKARVYVLTMQSFLPIVNRH
jgi:uncharacterized repeat protein (TIGR01451 family)